MQRDFLLDFVSVCEPTPNRLREKRERAAPTRARTSRADQSANARCRTSRAKTHRDPAVRRPDAMKNELDFDEEAQRLFSAFGLDGSRPVSSYHDMDKIWADRKTGAAIFVGNETAARGPLEAWNQRNITHVVNCTDDMPNFLEGCGPNYLRFNIARHHHLCTTPKALAAFVGELFNFVDSALGKGESVLVHCLAGAHRAGTTGVLLLMHKEGFNAEDAIRAAQALRPIINPIGQLPLLLKRFQAMRDAAHEQAWKEAEEARMAQEARLRAKQTSEGRFDAPRPAGYVGDQGDDNDDDDDDDDDIEDEEEDNDGLTVDAPLTQVLSVLSHISRRADRARKAAHALVVTARGAAEEDDDELGYEDDFEEDDDNAEGGEGVEVEEESPTRKQTQEEEPPMGRTPVRPPTYEDDISALKAAVDASRRAVAEVEARLNAAEAEEPERDAYVKSPLKPLATSVAAALGVPVEEAERALFETGDLEAALEVLDSASQY